jgi:hypothetical protein
MTRCLLRAFTMLWVCAVALPAASQDYGDILGPLPVRDQYLLSNGFFFFEPESANVLDDDDWLIDLHGADSNTFAKSRWISHNLAGDTDRRTGAQTLGLIRMDEGQSVFLVDGEIHRVTITAHRGLGRNLEVGIAIPFATIGGGTSDGFIERFHAAFGLGDNERVAMQRNRETVFLRADDRIYFRQRAGGTQLGDVALSAKYELSALEDPHLALSIEGALELPTGNMQTLDGSGSLDGGVQLLATRDYGRSRVHASAGILLLGHNGALGTKSQFVITDSIGVSFLLAERTSATAQITISQSPFRTIGAPELTRRSYQMTVGLQHAIGRNLAAYAGVVENLITYQNSADAGFIWGIARRF